MGKFEIGLLSICLLHASPALAWDDDGSCRNGMFAEENQSFGLARVSGRGPARFYEDMDQCPQETAACLQKAYVVPGDRVVTGRTKGAFICAYYPNKGGGSAGWMLRSRLSPIPVSSAPPLSVWSGAWANFDDWIVVRRNGRQLSVEGQAYWPSASPSLQERPGGPNMGSIGGPLQVSGNRAYEPECKVSFHLLGDILVVADPSRECDGLNVAFTGVYLRTNRGQRSPNPQTAPARGAGSPHQ